MVHTCPNLDKMEKEVNREVKDNDNEKENECNDNRER